MKTIPFRVLGAERKIEELQRFQQVLMDKLASEPLYYYEQAVELAEEAVAPLKRTNPDRDIATAVLAAGLFSACVGIWLARSGQHAFGDAVPA